MDADDAACRRAASRLTPWTDGTLEDGERLDLERHLERCPPCRHAADLERGGRALLRARAARLRDAPVPAGLQRRCAELAQRPPSRFGWPRRAVPAALMAGAALFMGAVLLSVGTSHSAGVLAAQLTADHLKCFHMIGAPDARDVDAGAVEAELRSRYGWQGRVPPSSADGGVQLLGVRRCLYAEGTVPHVMYRANGRDMSLYMLNGSPRPAAEVVTLGHRSRIWSSGDATFVLVARDSGAGLDAAAAYVMGHAR